MSTFLLVGVLEDFGNPTVVASRTYQSDKSILFQEVADFMKRELTDTMPNQIVVFKNGVEAPELVAHLYLGQDYEDLENTSTTEQEDIVDKLRRLYLDYVNNFISVDGFAAHYDMSRENAESVINAGKVIHERRTTPKGDS